MTAPRRRADATKNRARIVEVARAHLLTSNDLKLNEIAKSAGVGQGTLYRHFPTREDLLAAVYHGDLEALVASAPRLLNAHEPAEALALWFDEIVEYARVKRGVLAAVTASVGAAIAGPSSGRIADVLTTMLDAGKAKSQIRPDADARDVLLLISSLMQVDESEWDTRAPRLMRVVLDGLRARK